MMIKGAYKHYSCFSMLPIYHYPYVMNFETHMKPVLSIEAPVFAASGGVQALWSSLHRLCSGTPVVSIVVPFFGLTNSILRFLKGNPQKELQWRL